MTPEHRDFFKLPDEQRYAKFGKFPTEKQIDYFRIGMYREPPDLQLAEIIARKGEEVIPSLIKRLNEEESETARADLIYLFSKVSRYYPALKEDKEVINVLRETTSSMKISANKSRSELYISLILNASSDAPVNHNVN